MDLHECNCRDVLEAMKVEAGIMAFIGLHPQVVELIGITDDFMGKFGRLNIQRHFVAKEYHVLCK